MKYYIYLFILFIASCSRSDIDIYNEAKVAASENQLEIQFEKYKEIVERHPESKYHSEALFQLGFIQNNHFKNFEEAKKYYSEFIKLYPSHELTDDARMELKYIGVPLDELPMFKDKINTVK